MTILWGQGAAPLVAVALKVNFREHQVARPCQKGTRPCALRRQYTQASGRMAVPKRHTAVRRVRW